MLLSVKRGQAFLATIILAVIIVYSGCTKDPSQIGLGLQPPNDKINAKLNDTTTIHAHSVRVDSIVSSNTPLSLLGSIADPVFGTTTTAFSTQFRLSESAHSFGDNPVIDSLVLTLKYDSLYGGHNIQNVKVYELAESLTLDSNYFSNTVKSTYGTLLGQKYVVPNLQDSVITSDDTLAPHLRIRLSDLSTELAEKLLAADSSQMANNEAFLDYFHGLRVECVDRVSGGGIILLDLNDNLSEMQIYYSNDEKDSLKFDYVISSSSARYGNFYHDYERGSMDFVNQIVYGDTSLGEQTLYVQPLGGVITKIEFPYATAWFKDNPVAINEAKLILDGYEDMPEYDPPNTLALVQVINDSTLGILPDQGNGYGYFGGYYDEENNQYFFRITEYFQDIISENITNNTLELAVDGGSYIPSRYIINGTDPIAPVPFEKRFRLEVTYTIVN